MPDVFATEELRDKYPERRIEVFDSMGAGLGIGLLAMKAADYRDEGLNMECSSGARTSDRSGLCEYFTVDDLMHLRRGGRLSGIAAMVGTVLNVKPLLRGDEEGKIVVFSKLRGRKKAIEAIAHEYEAKAVDPQHQRVAISHGDCLEDAEKLAEMVRAIAEPEELIISMRAVHRHSCRPRHAVAVLHRRRKMKKRPSFAVFFIEIISFISGDPLRLCLCRRHRSEAPSCLRLRRRYP